MTASEGSGRGRSPFGFTFIAPLALGATLNPINSTMLSTALVPIAESLHADIAETGWLIAVLYLTTAVAQPSLGRLVDLRAAFISDRSFWSRRRASSANGPHRSPDS